MFWAQSPLFAAAGITLFFAIPILPVEEGKSAKDRELSQKIRQIDFLGAVLLVRRPQSQDKLLLIIFPDYIARILSLCIFCSKDTRLAYHCFTHLVPLLCV